MPPRKTSAVAGSARASSASSDSSRSASNTGLGLCSTMTARSHQARCEWVSGATSAVALERTLRPRRSRGEDPVAEHLDDRPLGQPDIVLAVRQLTEDPAGEDLLQRAVEDEACEARVDVVAELARPL